jgi:predicted DNA-binding transcriptional regulator AlpA
MMTTKQVAALLGWSESAVRGMIGKPPFPNPVPNRRKPYCWRDCDIIEYNGSLR